ncbi:outer membrane lipoprotein-sorting protein [Sulfurovum sp. zt1-1]|uniref:Outer membrane lipoprotein-sorting protein n=1 Tax=Sulfurovum zhangzhouensis TaxID=3019067 RepID=A0ABT7QX37_9BACT|nr:outer membrane lipoprotein-sorting protein [Sulfurovum zhangzhouensis]MDM5271388.1 outer membrane lipoprotein-sorting protein [Sulfurovum zhangzhouensis]
MKKIILIGMIGIASLGAESSLEVAKKSFERISGYKSSISKTTMVLKNAQGIENKRQLIIKRLENKNGDKSLIHFIYPLDIKGTKLLSFEQIGKDDKQWLYMPALKRIKRISSRNKSGSFMASEFSYEDISSQNYKNYTYSGDAKVVKKNNTSYFKVVRIPKDQNSGYSKQIVYIDSSTYLARSGEYYDKLGKLLKEVEFLQYKKIDGVYRIQKINMQNIQNGKSTMLIWDEDQINIGLGEADFSKKELQ